MKLLMISGDRILAEGKQGAFYATLEELSKHFERIDVITPEVKNQKSEVSFFGNVYVHPSHCGLWYQPWWILKKGKELINQHHHAVMTVHEFPPFYNGIGAKKLHRATGIPYTLEMHHLVGFPKPASLSECIGKLMTKWFFAWDARTAKAIRTVNEEVLKKLTAHGVLREKIKVVPSFYLDRTLLAPDTSIEKMYDLVSAGRLVANKGFFSLLDALKELPDRTLLIIGDGPLRKKLQHHAHALGIASRVTFIGWLATSSDVYRALQSGKVFIMNSTSEGGPRVALEAMALGLPVLSTRVGVMSDVLQDHRNGIFTHGDCSDLAAKIKELLDQPELRERIGMEARNITEKFERTTLIRQYADFLKSLA